MPKLTIDGQEIEVTPGTVLIQACEQLGIEIPRFCYHERLAIAGNCRMCLVEVSPGPPKPQASCALPCADGMIVKTNSPMVKKAREGVMEFLLINHPLDCPICDQGGECDLQDQALFYGKGISRYRESKRAVEDKYMGPIVKTEMTRCIHCTRCVRFITDVAGVPDLGATGRGEHMEITTYVEKAISSELSGNIVDLCPVGALTSKPYAFLARPWELKKTESIDVMDAVGSAIRVDSRGNVVLRILPRVNEDINEEWISDKTRHACDGLRVSRLDKPYVRGRDGKLKEAGWAEALNAIGNALNGLRGEQIAAVAGNLADCESVLALKDLMTALGSPNIDCRQEGAKLPSGSREDYLFNTTIAGIEQADVCLLVAANPRLEASILNTRIRKAVLHGLKVYSIGPEAELTYACEHLGNDPQILAKIAEGKHPLSKALKGAKHPMVIVGMSALAREDGDAVYASARKIGDACARENWNGFNVLHHAAGRVGALDLGFVPQQGGKDMAGILAAAKSGAIKFVYLLGADEFDMAMLGKAFVVYQGHHGDDGAHRADVILPGSAYTEKDATYVNLEGRVQRTERAIFPPGEAKEDWAIVCKLADALGKSLPYQTLQQVRAKMEKIMDSGFRIQDSGSKKSSLNSESRILTAPFESFIPNFYMTDPISRASKTMAACTKEILGQGGEKKVA